MWIVDAGAPYVTVKYRERVSGTSLNAWTEEYRGGSASILEDTVTNMNTTRDRNSVYMSRHGKIANGG